NRAATNIAALNQSVAALDLKRRHVPTLESPLKVHGYRHLKWRQALSPYLKFIAAIVVPAKKSIEILSDRPIAATILKLSPL
ncbi:hypothetical protein TorRG33x02_356880, partial [Trema orientale]